MNPHLLLSVMLAAVVVPTAQAQSLIHTFAGEAPDDGFGVSCALLGDLDGDGVGDLIVGAQFDDDGGADAGSARVLSGTSGGVLFTLHGDSPSAYFGFAVSSAGDVNRDGCPDILVGGFGDDLFGANSGMARVHSGRDLAVLHTLHGGSLDAFGGAVAGAGDVDGDGFADLLIGVQNDTAGAFQSGSAQLFSGRDGSLLRFWSGEASNDLFGAAVGVAGDWNGDGVNDLVIGAPFTDVQALNAGTVYVVSGRDGTLVRRFEGSTPGGNFGVSVSHAGDVNGDGVADLIIGARNDAPFGTTTGAAYVYSGADGALLHRFHGAAAGDLFGRSVAGAGDVDGDGFADLIVGASLNANAGTADALAELYSGYDGRVLARFHPPAAGGRFRTVVAGAGDVNGDGFDEVMVATPVGNNARVFSVATPTLILSGLIHRITALDLPPGVSGSFTGKIEDALEVLGDSDPDNDHSAARILEALIRQIEAQRGKAVADDEADDLIAAVLRAIGSIPRRG